MQPPPLSHILHLVLPPSAATYPYLTYCIWFYILVQPPTPISHTASGFTSSCSHLPYLTYCIWFYIPCSHLPLSHILHLVLHPRAATYPYLTYCIWFYILVQPPPLSHILHLVSPPRVPTSPISHTARGVGLLPMCVNTSTCVSCSLSTFMSHWQAYFRLENHIQPCSSIAGLGLKPKSGVYYDTLISALSHLQTSAFLYRPHPGLLLSWCYP